MYIDRKQIMESFLEMVDYISDLEYQERVWIKGSGPDFDEIVCLFLGEGDPILESYKDFNITDHQYSLLKKLIDEFRAFSVGKGHTCYQSEFISSPEWNRIVKMGKGVLESFGYRKESRK